MVAIDSNKRDLAQAYLIVLPAKHEKGPRRGQAPHLYGISRPISRVIGRHRNASQAA
jgi:hypothetical protein